MLNKAVMVLGMSGTGKSTLINYLNDIPLVCVWKRDWVLDLLSKNLSLTNIATIGHNINSHTFIPAVYKNKDFIYIDNPGFKDTHGLATEVANGFFRQLITSNVKELKFLLLLAYSDLKQNRGQQFRESIKAFSRFISAFDDNNVAKYLGKSIGIIVTKVDHESANDEGERITKTDDEMKYELRIDLNRTLNDELFNNKLSQNEGIIFNQIIKNFQIEIFSNPKKKGPVKTHQADAINILIKNKLQYAEKKDLKLRVQISNEYRADLIKYISDHYIKFGESLNNELDKVLSKWILKRKKNTSDLNEKKNLYLKLNEFVSQSLNHVSFDDFVKNVMTELLSKE
jgi:GTP-binding protein EngB required for normal cell division